VTPDEEPRTPSAGDTFFFLAVWYLILTPVVMLFWNVGLEDSGIVDNDINWLTAFALALGLSLLANMFGRRR
jgi:hypothetical protein